MYGTQTAMVPVGLADHWDHVSSGEWADILAEFPLFAGVRKRNLRKLVRNATVAEYGSGDVVVAAGTPSDSVYVILSGSAKARGKRAARTLRTGDYFGELGALAGAPRSATVVATGELHVVRLPREAFVRLAERHPSISLALLSNLGGQVRRLELQAA